MSGGRQQVAIHTGQRTVEQHRGKDPARRNARPKFLDANALDELCRDGRSVGPLGYLGEPAGAGSGRAGGSSLSQRPICNGL